MKFSKISVTESLDRVCADMIFSLRVTHSSIPALFQQSQTRCVAQIQALNSILSTASNSVHVVYKLPFSNCFWNVWATSISAILIQYSSYTDQFPCLLMTRTCFVTLRLPRPKKQNRGLSCSVRRRCPLQVSVTECYRTLFQSCLNLKKKQIIHHSNRFWFKGGKVATQEVDGKTTKTPAWSVWFA